MWLERGEKDIDIWGKNILFSLVMEKQKFSSYHSEGKKLFQSSSHKWFVAQTFNSFIQNVY